jgi:predicted O-methyltransferase YrrM
MRPLAHFLLWRMGLVRPTTQTTEAERNALARYAANQKTLVEIGVWHGVTTSRLCRVMASDAVLLAVDPFPPGRLGFSPQRLIAQAEVHKVARGRVIWMRTSGAEAAQQFTTSRRGAVDFVFMDGDHSYDGIRADWEAWSPLLALNGVAALHDSCSSSARSIEDCGSVVFTRETVRTDPRFELVEVVDTLSVYRRKTIAAGATQGAAE